LVGYESTNIYQIWIPHKKKVIWARDVLFDEEEFYDGKLIQFTDILISELDEAIAKVAIPPNRDLDDVQLKEDGSDVEDAEDIQDINGIKDINEKGPEPIWNDSDSAPYPIPEPTIESSFLTGIDLAMPVRSEGVKLAANLVVLPDRITPDLLEIPEYEPAVIDGIQQQNKDRFYNFHQYRVPQTWHTAFQAGSTHWRDTPSPPKNFWEVTGYRYEAQFKESMEGYIKEHVNLFKSWTEVEKLEVKGQQILGCMWVFVYKTDKHRRITKCKARLVVCGNQQRECDLPTRATTLATTSLRVLLATVAKCYGTKVKSVFN
jgi:hypothetical protein